MFIGCTLFLMFWGGFIVAEGDAYGHGHGGYIHSPWGILCYAAAVVLGIPGMNLIARLWQRC
jgi:hypothetical protein